MLLINTKTFEYPITVSLFKETFPNISFKADMGDKDFEKFGFAVVNPVAPPVHTQFQKVVEVTPIETDGKWNQQWSIVDLEGEELSKATYAAEKEQAVSDNLPSWEQVETDVDNIGSLADAKAFLKKLSRVVYLVVKQRVD